MACFTKAQQRNGINYEFEKYVTTNKFFVLNSLDKSNLNSDCTQCVCDKSENARVCAKWLWNALALCYWIAHPASPVMQSSNTISCVSLSFRTHPCVLAINSSASAMELCLSCTDPSISSFMFYICPDHYHNSAIFHVGYDAIALS